MHCSFISWSGQNINNTFFTFLGRSVALKIFPFFKKALKIFKRKKCQVFYGVGINIDEEVLGFSQTPVYLQEAKGRELLITTEKEEISAMKMGQLEKES